VPTYAAELRKPDWSDERVLPARRHRCQLASWENLAADVKRRNYPEATIGKILGGNLLRIMRQVLPKSFAHTR